QGVELGREGELAGDLADVERLDPEWVAGEEQPPGASVPQRDREHAPQTVEEGSPPLLVAVHEHLGVAVRAEAMAGALELTPQLPVVVDLAVLDDGDAAVLVGDRLVARLEVDDR